MLVYICTVKIANLKKIILLYYNINIYYMIFNIKYNILFYLNRKLSNEL